MSLDQGEEKYMTCMTLMQHIYTSFGHPCIHSQGMYSQYFQPCDFGYNDAQHEKGLTWVTQWIVTMSHLLKQKLCAILVVGLGIGGAGGGNIAVNSFRCLFYLKSEKKEIAHFRSPVFQSEQCLCLAW